MTVRVTLKRDISQKSPTVESFDDEKDQFTERADGKLEIHRADGTVKIYTADRWLTVDGHRMTPGIA